VRGYARKHLVAVEKFVSVDRRREAVFGRPDEGKTAKDNKKKIKERLLQRAVYLEEKNRQ